MENRVGPVTCGFSMLKQLHKWSDVDQSGNRRKHMKTVRQRDLPEDLRERGVAVIRPEGQNSSRVRGGLEESVTERERGFFFLKKEREPL